MGLQALHFNESFTPQTLTKEIITALCKHNQTIDNTGILALASQFSIPGFCSQQSFEELKAVCFLFLYKLTFQSG